MTWFISKRKTAEQTSLKFNCHSLYLTYWMGVCIYGSHIYSSHAVSLALFFIFLFVYFWTLCFATKRRSMLKCTFYMDDEPVTPSKNVAFFVTLLHDAMWKWWSFLQRCAQCMTNNQSCNHSILYRYITRTYYSRKSLCSSVVRKQTICYYYCQS